MFDKKIQQEILETICNLSERGEEEEYFRLDAILDHMAYNYPKEDIMSAVSALTNKGLVSKIKVQTRGGSLESEARSYVIGYRTDFSKKEEIQNFLQKAKY